jgi:hypothetical protein
LPHRGDVSYGLACLYNSSNSKSDHPSFGPMEVKLGPRLYGIRPVSMWGGGERNPLLYPLGIGNPKPYRCGSRCDMEHCAGVMLGAVLDPWPSIFCGRVRRKRNRLQSAHLHPLSDCNATVFGPSCDSMKLSRRSGHINPAIQSTSHSASLSILSIPLKKFFPPAFELSSVTLDQRIFKGERPWAL